ncbi:Protein of unknown function [Cotesia congregata]|uniref:DUF7041 domain-containing protein n=1 Tax=Cotesia congregata TaxID=51543 RepID=A0A8J2H6T2_COTCN|nr:Protein of unknown function [Cotesia congregata]
MSDNEEEKMTVLQRQFTALQEEMARLRENNNQIQIQQNPPANPIQNQDEPPANPLNNDEGQDNNQNPQGTNQLQLATITSYKLPPFWKNKPQLWFTQIETIFRKRNIRSERSKYDAVVEILEQYAVEEISDIIEQPVNDESYKLLKDTMIKRFSESSERQLHRLLSEVELGDKKPSQLLRQMRDLGRNQATDNLLKTKWMSLLPSHVTNVLLVAQNVDLNQQADIADKLMENSNGNVMEVETTNSQEVHSIKNPPAKQSDDRLDKLENMILELQKSVRQLRGTNKATFQENRSRSRSRPRFRSADGTCYYL